ncbi:LOW QUALITY PROTEIN: myosin light chain kinase 2, skeletal/cardiac muscle [Triplophysa dalaica]|uniref:LOW QUALITY PROTEIN: myosin light chain kinase 2, skeletal/cardiac muscle n=1 Tax=Triplophysa dalaica TaxID=1582913 RepID=UPI0024E01BA1|nr:LOW QUALITY PROTEIN: myosin light chain kinase 2, skeletal/cardiac muscle [Triplophysa dalaica]
MTCILKWTSFLPWSSGRGCPLCGTCAHHSTLQEAMTSQLSAQARLLDSLERKVLEMRTALEDLACGLGDRLCENVSVPLVALQRRKSLPVRTSMDEVYVRLDTPRERKIVSQVFNVASEKGTLVEVNEINRMRREDHLTEKYSSEVKIQHEVKSQNTGEKEKPIVTSKSSNNLLQTQNIIQMENKNNIKTPIVAPVSMVSKKLVAPRSPSPKPEVQNEKKVLTPNSEAAKMTPTSAPITKTAVLSDTIVPKPNIQPQNHNVPKKIEPVSPQQQKWHGTSTPVPNIASKMTSLDVSTAASPIHTPSTANLVPPAQSFGTSSENKPTTKIENSTLFPPSHKPLKTVGLTVTTATKEASLLRQVQSCPNSLQRLQIAAGKKDAPLTSPSEKTGPESPESKHEAGGIRIKISPAVDKPPAQAKVNNPPKTCLKVIDDVPSQPAPFSHRFVALKSNPPPCDTFSIHTREVLGGGRFGKVHKCTENKTGMRLAAKIINTRNAKERDMALNEIQVMNQLSHPNILQLHEAFEVKNQVVLILEFVEGGELFERIVDESCPLTEVDAMVFVKQICEGVQYMHQMYVLHLDLKPENILLVNHSSHQVKIIDFGLARRYKPREKLKVSFGTPEFLSPEVVNFDFVSFPTDMWTLGVVTYMLLSGLSPFLGDDDNQTLNNVLLGNWYFDEDAFEHVSAEARDFVTNLLIRERSGRLSASQCLKHPWLNNISEKAKSSNIVLKSQVLLKKYMARRMWKKNYIAIAAANRFKKIGSSGSLTSLAI